MKTVSFKSMALEGFGPYRSRVNVEFRDGINIYVAPNESGKSSLVNGLSAILFGLPSVADRGSFGQGRFRSWDGPSRFEGELRFEAGGEVFRVRRNFDTHEVSLARLEEGKWMQIAGGEHNVKARRKNLTYEEALKAILTITSRQLFEATFLIAQPMPEARTLDASVQDLLSGTGGNLASASAELLDELRQRTRHISDRGIPLANGRIDRRLETLEAQRASLAEEIGRARAVADSLECVKLRSTEVEDQLRRAKLERDRIQGIKNAWSEWRRLKDQYGRATRDQNKVASDHDRAKALTDEIYRFRASLAQDYPEYHSYKGDPEEDLNAVSAAADRTKQAKALLDQAEARRKEVCESLRSAGETLAGFRSFGRLGQAPSEFIQRAAKNAQAAVKAWSEFLRRLTELREIGARLERDYSVFVSADEYELRAIESYGSNRAALEARLRMAEAEAHREREKAERYRVRREQYEREYGDLAHMPEHAGQAIEELIRLKREERRIAELEAARAKAVVRPEALGLLAGVFAFIAGWSLGLRGALPLAVAVATGFLVYAVLGRPRRNSRNRGLDSELETVRESIKAVVPILGDIANFEEASLGGLLERVRQKESMKASLAEEAGGISDESGLHALDLACDAARKAVEELRLRADRFSAVTGDPESGLAQYRDLTRRKRELEQLVTAYSSDCFGVEPDIAHLVDPLVQEVSEVWRTIAQCCDVLNTGQRTVGDLASFLADKGEAWWSQAINDARAYESSVRGADRLTRELEVLDQEVERLEAGLKATSLEESQARNKVWALLEPVSGDVETAKQRLKDRARRLLELDGLSTTLGHILERHGAESLEALGEIKTRADNAAYAALMEWKDFIGKNPGLPEVREADNDQAMTSRYLAISESAARAEGRLKDLDEEAQRLTRELGRLEGHKPLNIAQAEIDLAQLDRDIASERVIVEALAMAYTEVSASISDFQASYRSELERMVSSRFSEISGVAGREIVIGAGFEIGLNVDGAVCDPRQLSKGAQDQLYISLRLAIADLLASGSKLPFIFDDPFLACDENRLGNLRKAIEKVAGERQVIILSHNASYLGWGTAVSIG